MTWPFGHRVTRDGDVLAVVDWFGVVKREGDRVRLGGGEITTSGEWTVCGLLEVEPQ